MSRTSRPVGGTMDFLVEEFPVLSNKARKFVRSHPRQARAAIVVALEAVAAQQEISDVAEVPGRLRPYVVRRSADEGMIGVSEAAKRLGVSRTTVHAWAKTNKLIAWKTSKPSLRIPAGQILGPERIVPGIKDVVDIIGDPELAWAFLTQEWAFEETVALPLDLLRDNRIDEVLGVAPGFGDTFT